MFRFIIVTAILIFVCNPIFAKDYKNELPKDAEEALFRLQYLNLVKTEISCIYYKNSVYVPLSDIFDNLKVNYKIDFENLIIKGTYINRDSTYEIDLVTNKVRFVDRTYDIDEQDYLLGPTNIYFLPGFFKKIFNFDINIKFTKLLVNVSSDYEFPIKIEVSRERSHSFLMKHDDYFSPKPLMYDVSRSILNGFLLSYTVDANYVNKESYTSGNANLGGEIFGGDFQNITYFNHSSVNNNLIYTNEPRWRLYLGDNPYMTQFMVGYQDYFSYRVNYLPNQYFKGVRVTNETTQAPMLYGSITIKDKIEPGWQVELYQNGVLINQMITDPQGFYTFNLPVNYGSSNIELKFHGPTGESYSKRDIIKIPLEFLKPGEIKYTLNAGRDKFSNDLFGNGRLTVGLTNWLTNTFDYTYNDNQKHQYYRDEMTLKFSNDLYMSADYFHNEMSKLIINYWPLDYGSYRISQTWNTKQNQFLSPDIITLTELNLSLPRFFNSTMLSIFDQFYNNRNDFRNSMNAFLSFYVFPFNMTFNYKADYIQTRLDKQKDLTQLGAVSAGYNIVSKKPNAFWGSSNITVNTNLDVTNYKFQNAGVMLSQQFFRDLNLAVTGQYDFYNKKVQINALLTLNLNFVRGRTSATRFERGDYGYGQSLEGVLGFNSADLSFLISNPSYNSSFGNSAAMIRCFLDTNNNGKYDKGEYIIPDIKVTIPFGRVEDKAKDGKNYAYSLIPYSQYNVIIDKRSIKNPNWVPKYTEFSFIADPGVVKAIDVPVYATGIIEGNVYKIDAGKRTGQPGVKVHLWKTDGSYHETQPVFSDGSFYKMGLMPGDYIAWVDSLQCAILRVVLQDSIKHFTIKSARNGDFVGDINFELFDAVAKPAEQLKKDDIKSIPDVPQEQKFPEVPKQELGNEKKQDVVLYYGGAKTSNLSYKMQLELDKIINYMQSHTASRLKIDGHSDNFGTMEENMRISKLRADMVVNYLIRKGISKDRLLWTGHGALYPVANNGTPEGREKNRRVEVKIIK